MGPHRYDIEDAIVMNRASLDRGFGRCIVLKKTSVPLRKYANRASDRIVAAVPAPGARVHMQLTPHCVCGCTTCS